MGKLKIEYLNTDDLIPYEGNAKKHPQSQIDQIVESIKENGFLDPVAIWQNNEIIEGHGRVIAAKQMGIKKLPVIRLDDLTDEQRRSYILVHNQLTMNSGFDPKILEVELAKLPELDMEKYGFTMPDLEALHEKYQTTTQKRVANIENLEIGEYPGRGKYDIPNILPVRELPEIKEWIGFNYVLSDKEPEGKAVHFFIDDYQFERLWNDPDKYVDLLKRYVCVASPDFSPYGDMPMALQIYNHYRKHWVAAYLQEHGVTVIPTVRASTDERSMEWYLDGEPRGGIVLISSMWTNTDKGRSVFMQEYNTMYETLNPTKVFLYGEKLEGLQGNIELIDTFTRKRWAQNG